MARGNDYLFRAADLLAKAEGEIDPDRRRGRLNADAPSSATLPSMRAMTGPGADFERQFWNVRAPYWLAAGRRSSRMRDANYLRAQAELCLEIARQISDHATAEDLRAPLSAKSGHQ
jgi:hypothetical protein